MFLKSELTKNFKLLMMHMVLRYDKNNRHAYLRHSNLSHRFIYDPEGPNKASAVGPIERALNKVCSSLTLPSFH